MLTIKSIKNILKLQRPMFCDEKHGCIELSPSLIFSKHPTTQFCSVDYLKLTIKHYLRQQHKHLENIVIIFLIYYTIHKKTNNYYEIYFCWPLCMLRYIPRHQGKFLFLLHNRRI